MSTDDLSMEQADGECSRWGLALREQIRLPGMVRTATPPKLVAHEVLDTRKVHYGDPEDGAVSWHLWAVPSLSLSMALILTLKIQLLLLGSL